MPPTRTGQVSVVLPTKDRPDSMPAVLAALAAQDLDGLDAELVVVDNGSAPATRTLLRELVDAFPWPVRLIDEPRPGVASARNAGARAARHPILVFLNDDVVPPDPRWLSGHARALADLDDEHAGILGPVVWHPDVEITPVMRWLARKGMSHTYDTLRSGRSEPAELYANNLSLHRSAFERAGGFDDRFTSYGWQEYDLALRLHDQGFRLVLAPGLVAWHMHVHELDESLRRQERIGRTTVLFNRIHADRPGLRTPHPPRWKVAVGAALAPIALRLRPPRGAPEPVASVLLTVAHHAALARGMREGLDSHGPEVA